MIFVYLAFSSFYLISFLPRNKIPQTALNVTAVFFFFFLSFVIVIEIKYIRVPIG